MAFSETEVKRAWESFQAAQDTEPAHITREILLQAGSFLQGFSDSEVRDHGNALDQLMSIGLFAVTTAVDQGGVGAGPAEAVSVLRRVGACDLSLAVCLADHLTTQLAFVGDGTDGLRSTWGGIVEAYGRPVVAYRPGGGQAPKGGPTTHRALGLRGLQFSPQVQAEWLSTFEASPGSSHGSRRLALAAVALGAAERVHKHARAHGETRVQFRKALAKNTLIGRMLLGMKLRIRASSGLITAGLVAQEGDFGLSTLRAALHATETAAFCAQWAMEILGGNALMEDSGITREFRDIQGIRSLFLSDTDRMTAAHDWTADGLAWSAAWDSCGGVDASPPPTDDVWAKIPGWDPIESQEIAL